MGRRTLGGEGSVLVLLLRNLRELWSESVVWGMERSLDLGEEIWLCG